MKTKLIFPLAALIALALLLGGCATGMTPSSWNGMTADADYVYLSGGTNVYAVNLVTQAEAWRFPIKATVFSAPVLTGDGQLLVGGYDHILYSLDPEDASENWQFSEARDRWIGSPLVANELIYAPNADYRLYALNLDGDPVWSFRADQSLWGTPVTDGDFVYFGSLGGWIYALDATSGELAWKIKTDGAVLGSPVIKDDLLYFSLFTGSLVAIDTRDGDTLWQKTLGSWVWSGPLLENETLYVGDGKGNIYAYSLDGDLIWKQELNGAIVNNPVLLAGELVVGTDEGNIYFISLDGENIRSVSVDGQVIGPALSTGTLLLVSPTGGESELIAFTEGAQAWTFTPEK